MTHSVLIAEDERRMREVMMMQLSDFGLQFLEAADGRQAIELFEQQSVNLVITDLKLPKINGMDLLRYIMAADPEMPVIVNTAYGSIENAVEAIRLGAFDYITKPFKEEHLRRCVEKALKVSQLASQVRHLRRELEERYRFDKIIGNSPKICHVLELAGNVARTDTTVLITGESGTGKELLSRAIHFNSLRTAGPFLPVNCAAIPATLLEAELFGYEPGAFTDARRRQQGKLELASGGTLFLDEIGDMAMDMQAKLLRVLEVQRFQRLGGSKTIQVDLRIICATNRDLKLLVKSSQFREDLYYRINVFPIQLPPLREHTDDIAALTHHFIREFSNAQGRRPPRLTDKALEMLRQNTWRGNVRELKNVVERAMILCQSDRITARHLILSDKPGSGWDHTSRVPNELIVSLLEHQGIDIVDLEVRLLEQAMHLCANNVSRAARLLGLTRPTLRYRLEKYHLPRNPALA